MAAPNITDVTSIVGVTSAVSLSATTNPGFPTGGVIIVENPAGTNASYKVNSLYVCNVGLSSNNATVVLYRANPNRTFNIIKNVTVPAQSTLDVISNPVYLMENDSLRGTALSADGGAGMEAVCSFEIIK